MAEKKCTQCNNKASVSLIAAECEATRQHKIIRWLIWVNVLLVILLFGSNLAWTIYETQFETISETTSESYEVEQDTDVGNNNCAIRESEIHNGTSEN